MFYTDNEVFSVEEINLMCIYETSNRTRLIADMLESKKDVYEPELLEIMGTIVEKLERMTDDEYARVSFYAAGEYYETEE